MAKSSYQNVLTESDGEMLVVTLHRPERHNAMTHQMRVDLLGCVRRAEDDGSVHAIVFTGHGDKAFCAGADIPELYQRTLLSEMGNQATLRKELPTTVERLAKPTVAAINGYCFGAGPEFSLGCTVRIASDNASLGQPEITQGQIPGSGGTQRLYRYVGLGWAMQMVLTGETVDAETDLLIGIDYERKLYAILMATEDKKEGLSAYSENRAPNYKGR